MYVICLQDTIFARILQYFARIIPKKQGGSFRCRPEYVDKPRFVIVRSTRTSLGGALARGTEQSDVAIRSLVPLFMLKI